MSLTAFQPRANPAADISWQSRSTSSPLYQRLQELHTRMLAAHAARRQTLSANAAGGRDLFVASFLSEVFPSAFRFESGDVLDVHGHQSGTLDILIESPFVPCFPAGSESRGYLAEGVAAALEVEPNLAAAWEGVLATAGRLAPLRRNFGSFRSAGPAPMRRIPFFAVGYSGWTDPEAVKQRLGDGELDGILVIEPAIFASGPAFGGVVARGPWALSAVDRAVSNNRRQPGETRSTSALNS
jgi:hypothetical protein